MSDPEVALLTAVQALVAPIRQALGTTFALVDLVRYAAQVRARPLVVVERLVHTGYLGLCFAFTDFDLILMNPLIGAPGFETLYASTLIHEIVHVLRGAATPIPDTYASFIQRDVLFYAVVHNASAGDNVGFEEDVAESVASELVTHLPADLRGVHIPLPPELRLLYGYTD